MDYSLAALKLLSFQLKEVIEATSPSSSSSSSSSHNAFTLGGLLFQRAWLQVRLTVSPSLLAIPICSNHARDVRFKHTLTPTQGVLVLVLDEERLLIDDGTGVVELSLSSEFRLRPWKAGQAINHCALSTLLL